VSDFWSFALTFVYEKLQLATIVSSTHVCLFG
jgi:hypothetical protein